MRTLICAAALLCAAHAQATTWDFEIKGLVTELPNGYGDMPQTSGSFTGMDLNLNGVLELPEVTAFQGGGSTILPVQEGQSPHGDYRSALSSFSYSLQTGALSFSATDGFSMSLITGQWWVMPCCFRSDWGPDTTITVTMRSGTGQTSPVPELPTALLLASGLIASTAAPRRRTKAATS